MSPSWFSFPIIARINTQYLTLIAKGLPTLLFILFYLICTILVHKKTSLKESLQGFINYSLKVHIDSLWVISTTSQLTPPSQSMYPSAHKYKTNIPKTQVQIYHLSLLKSSVTPLWLQKKCKLLSTTIKSLHHRAKLSILFIHF